MKLDTRYAVLAKKLDKAQKEKIDALDIKGIGTREESYRTYPQGELAAQILGFVDNEGKGKYGLEQALNNELQGTPGQLRAITDAQGVPLVANTDNIITRPQKGDRILLTIDVSMQKQMEDILKAGLDKAKAKSGSAFIMDPSTGAIKAMANYPTYSPGEYYKVENGDVFNNAAVSAPLEVGSIMKPLTAAAALDKGVVNRNTTYYDPSKYKIGDATVTNIAESASKAYGDEVKVQVSCLTDWRGLWVQFRCSSFQFEYFNIFKTSNLTHSQHYLNTNSKQFELQHIYGQFRLHHNNSICLLYISDMIIYI
jgi:cell division protein FtsI/penicillin-binding protein 2